MDNGLNRRSYGFVDQSQERHQTTRGDIKEQRHRPRWPLWRIVFFPAILLWKVLSWFWQRFPRLNNKSKKNFRKKLLHAGITLSVFCFVFGTIVVAWVSKDLPDPDKLTDRRVAQSTKIYDRTGEHLLYEVTSEEKPENRTLVDLDAIPEHLIHGLIATEDKEFYTHKGIRPLSILRSLFYGIVRRERPRGTSTLTQQLVKNAILTNEKTLTRKIKEAVLSIRLEQKYSKDQILKIYFNEIPYGSTNYGVQAAARSYFGKDVSELDLQESATLAGFPKAPTRYLQNKEALKQRRDFVLERMYEEGYITREEADAAQASPVTLSQRIGDLFAPHFSLYVKQQLVDLYGEQRVDTGGLKVITSLDWEKQQLAELAVKEESEKRFAEAKANNASLVAIDPKTGHILAMVGSRNIKDASIDGWFNVATQGKRQPGSSFKPIIYAAAFEKGYTPDTVLFDVVTNFAVSGPPYIPKNYNLKEHGLVTMRTALQASLNIPAVKTLYLVGEKTGINFAERLGYTTLSSGDFGLTLVLGGGEVKLLDHVSAYGVFANNGIKHAPVSILRVEDTDGEILYQWRPDRGERVLSADVAATMSDVLSDDAARAFTFGAGGVLTLPGRPVAAKTGTTNNYVDAWTVGYTPSLVAGVWAGNSDNTPMNKGDGGSRVAAPIWNRFMRDALKDTPVESFPTPSPNTAEKPVLRGSQTGITLAIDKLTGKRASSSTPAGYIVQRSYVPPHTILHYVDKDDPRGSAPKNPAEDPQYGVWEAALQDWVRRRQQENPNWDISFEEPPTEYDDVHSLELIPSLTVLSPAPSSTLSTRQIQTNILVNAPRGVSRVTYKLDGRVISILNQSPFLLNHYVQELQDGRHLLTIVVEDDIGNRRIEEIPFVLDAGSEPPAVRWVERSLQLTQQEFPRTLFLHPFKIDQIKTVRIYREQNGGRIQEAEIGEFSNLLDNKLLWQWKYPGQGDFVLIVEVEDSLGNKSETDRIQARVQ